jgi:phenylalanyl-tRNA synthetase beta chain
VIGVLHPELGREARLAGPAVLFEVELEVLLARKGPSFRDFSRQPAVLRDLSVTVDEAVSAAEVLKCVGQAGGDMLQNLELFDVYRGEGIDSGQKSLTLSLTFQEASRTLDEAEVEASITIILDSLAKHLGAALRG